MRAHAAANRERILAEAERVFGEQGAAGSTEEVAHRAGVGIGTVFRHFPTKAALVEAALLRHFESLAREAAEQSDRDDAGPALRDLIRTMVATGSTKLTLASHLPAGELPAPVLDVADRLRTAVDDLLGRAAREGAARDDVGVDEVYLLIRALAQTSATASPDPATLDAAVDIVIAGITRRP